MAVKSGLWFDGVDDYLELPNNIPSQTDGEHYGIEVEFLSESFENYNRVLSITNGIKVFMGLFGYPGGLIRMRIDDGNNRVETDQINIPLHEVIKVIGIRDGNTLRIYLNDELKSEVTGTLLPILDDMPVKIGVSALYSDTKFHGLIRKIRLFTLDDRDVFNFDFTTGHYLDLSGNGNHPQVYGNPRFVGVHTKSGLWFPGKRGSYVDVGNIFAGAQQFVVGVEFEPNSFDSYQGIIGKWYSPYYTMREWLLALSPGGLFKMYWTDGNSLGAIEFITDYSLQKIIAVYDTVNRRMELWKDGILKVSGVPVITIQTTNQPIQMGQYSSTTPFKGLIKSAWVKTSIPLDITQEFIQWGQNADAYWDFTQGTLQDLSGNGNDGVAYGDVRFIGI